MRAVRLAIAWLMLIGSVVLWTICELGWVAQGEPKFVLRLSILAIAVEGFNAVSVNTDD